MPIRQRYVLVDLPGPMLLKATWRYSNGSVFSILLEVVKFIYFHNSVQNLTHKTVFINKAPLS